MDEVFHYDPDNHTAGEDEEGRDNDGIDQRQVADLRNVVEDDKVVYRPRVNTQ